VRLIRGGEFGGWAKNVALKEMNNIYLRALNANVIIRWGVHVEGKPTRHLEHVAHRVNME
jgi:hypothetical protein